MKGLVVVWSLSQKGVALAAIALVSSSSAVASASSGHGGKHGPFADCPLEAPSIESCVYTVISDGSVAIGRRSVPVTNPITLRGGFQGAGAASGFYGAKDGQTLSKAPQPVPGGLLGFPLPKGWPAGLRSRLADALAVTATAELAGPTTGLTEIQLNTGNLLFEKETALELPVRIKLENSLLGSSCYLGSSSEPIEIALTTGKSGSLQGTAGSFASSGSSTSVTLEGARLVDGAFPVAAAHGCGGRLSAFVDPLVDLVLGLPSAPDQNSVTLEGDLGTAAAAASRPGR